jgi:hypothetical protein
VGWGGCHSRCGPAALAASSGEGELKSKAPMVRLLLLAPPPLLRG